MKLFSTIKLFGFIFAPRRHFYSTGRPITAAVAAAQKKLARIGLMGH